MYFLLIILFVVVLWLLVKLAIQKNKQRKRALLIATSLPNNYREILLENFELYADLPKQLQNKLSSHIQVFLHEKQFVGCGGFVITDEVRLLIAAQACILIVNMQTDYFPGFRNILVYPDLYRVPQVQRDGFVHTESISVRGGESWKRGPVILAWSQVLHGAKNRSEGSNVVMHEFAHKLDEENSVMDGLPILTDRTHYRPWAEILTREYRSLQQNVLNNEPNIIDPYGASSPVEFFAVVTEIFFNKPQQLYDTHPELYQQFERYYQLDPKSWKQL